MPVLFDIAAFGKNAMDSIRHRRKYSCTLIAFLIIVLHFVFLMVHFEPAISTPDAQGYFVQAKLIAKDGKTWLTPESTLQYVGPHWLSADDNRYFTTFPPGLPAMLSVIYRIFGPEATLLFNPLMASLSLLGLFLLCRLWIGRSWALLAIALMAVNPFANEHALFGDSHTAVVFFLIWALFFLSQWIKTRSSWWALATGLFIGVVPAIRYPETVFCLGFGVFVLYHLRCGIPLRRSVVAAMIGAAIPIGLLCIHSQVAFGAFWKTGYGLPKEQTLFHWNHFANNWLPYLRKILTEGLGSVFVLGLTGIVILCGRRDTRKRGLLLAALVLPVTLVYMSYYWQPDPQSMRFLLPTFFIYTIASVWLLGLIGKKHHLIAWVSSALLLSITVFWGLPGSIQATQHLEERNAVLAHVTSVIEEHVEPGNILIASEGISQHLDFIGRWRLVDPIISRLTRSEPSPTFIGRRHAPPKKHSRNIEGHLKYDNLAGQEFFTAFSSDVWQWAENGRKIYVVATEAETNVYRSQLSQYERLVMICKIELPPERSDDTPNSFSPSRGPRRGSIPHLQGPHGPNRIFDLSLTGKPLFLVEWIRE